MGEGKSHGWVRDGVMNRGGVVLCIGQGQSHGWGRGIVIEDHRRWLSGVKA